MRRKAVSVTMLTLLLASMLTLAFEIELVSAMVPIPPPSPDYPAIYVDPPVVEGVTPGNNVTVSVKTNYTGDDITAYQFHLSFNPNVLHGINVTNGDLFTIDKHPGVVLIPGTFNNTEGKLSLTGTFIFLHPPGPPPLTSGPGTLANVTFTVVGYGCSNITLGPHTKLIGITDGGWGDPYDIINAQTMPNHIGHGYFNNIDGGGDVAVTNVLQWFKDPPVTNEAYHTWPVNVNVTLENVNCRTVNVSVSVYYDTIVVGPQTVTDLLSGETRNLTIICDLTSLNPGWISAYYTLKANATTIDLADVNLADNEFVYGQVRIRRWGDVDGNDQINILDLKLMKLAYSGIIEHAFLPFTDLNGDCSPNILDLKIVWLICSGYL